MVSMERVTWDLIGSALSTKIAADTAEPIKSQVTRSMETIRKTS